MIWYDMILCVYIYVANMENGALRTGWYPSAKLYVLMDIAYL